MKEEQIKILQTALFILDGEPDSLLLKYNLLPYREKAKEVVRVIIRK